MSEHNESEDDLEENSYIEIPASADKDDDLDLDFPKRKEAVREKFGADDPDFDVLWDLSVRELEEICGDEDHPLHEKANRFLAIAMEPLRETMKNVVLPIFESMPKPDLSGISNMLSSISESIKPTIDVSAFNNILKGINIPQVDTSMLFPQIETMKLLANYDPSRIYSGIDLSAITSAVDTSLWLSSIAPSLPKYEISSEWRTALEAANHTSEEDDQYLNRNFVESEDEHADEETSNQESPSSISQTVEIKSSPRELMAYELVEVIASRVDGVNETLHHFLNPMLQAMMQSTVNTAEAKAKIEEANRLSVLANSISDQANRIIEEAGKSSAEINNKMLTRASWSAWLAFGAMFVSALTLLYTVFWAN